VSQLERLYNLLKDHDAHRTDEIVREVYGMTGPSIARLSARIHDMKKKYGVEVRSWRDRENPKLWWYMILCPLVAVLSRNELPPMPKTLFPMVDQNIA